MSDIDGFGGCSLLGTSVGGLAIQVVLHTKLFIDIYHFAHGSTNELGEDSFNIYMYIYAYVYILYGF